MNCLSNEIDQLIDEHQAFVRHYGKAQSRCSDLMVAQAAELAKLQAQAVRLRAAVIVRDSALVWEREDRAALRALIPGRSRRITLARRVDRLVERIQDLMRERLRWRWRQPLDRTPASSATPIAVPPQSAQALAMPIGRAEQVEDDIGFETSLAAADLVICQTGCLSHDAYWRVHDHCKRTGKACIVMAQPDAVRIVRIHRTLSRGNPNAAPVVVSARIAVDEAARG